MPSPAFKIHRRLSSRMLGDVVGNDVPRTQTNGASGRDEYDTATIILVGVGGGEAEDP